MTERTGPPIQVCTHLSHIYRNRKSERTTQTLTYMYTHTGEWSTPAYPASALRSCPELCRIPCTMVDHWFRGGEGEGERERGRERGGERGREGEGRGERVRKEREGEESERGSE